MRNEIGGGKIPIPRDRWMRGRGSMVVDSAYSRIILIVMASLWMIDIFRFRPQIFFSVDSFLLHCKRGDL